MSRDGGGGGRAAERVRVKVRRRGDLILLERRSGPRAATSTPVARGAEERDEKKYNIQKIKNR